MELARVSDHSKEESKESLSRRRRREMLSQAKCRSESSSVSDSTHSDQQQDQLPQQTDEIQVCDVEWFNLKKFETKNFVIIEEPRLQRKVKEVIEKHNRWV